MDEVRDADAEGSQMCVVTRCWAGGLLGGGEVMGVGSQTIVRARFVVFERGVLVGSPVAFIRVPNAEVHLTGLELEPGGERV
jgi:hypothetical protein